MWRRLSVLTTVLALLLVAVPGWAAFEKEILQAVKDGVPNAGDSRVVMGEVFASDG